MEAYFPTLPKQPTDTRPSRHSSPRQSGKNRATALSTDGPSASEITKHLLKTLNDVHNPITHSDIGGRTDNVVAFAKGHQVAEDRRITKRCNAEKEHKLSAQRGLLNRSDRNELLAGIRIYINGYLKSTTDIELKRLVFEAGGEIVSTASRSTHIVTSQGLCASKTHQILSQNSRTKRHVVKPEWVTDSIREGKRLPERSYPVVKNTSTLETFLKSSS